MGYVDPGGLPRWPSGNGRRSLCCAYGRQDFWGGSEI